MTEFAQFESDFDESYYTEESTPLAAHAPPRLGRPGWTIIPLTIPVFLCGFSWMSGGLPFVTDLGFTVLAVLCVTYLLFEVRNFTRRYGIGAMVLFGGTLIWYCHDYFSNWYGQNFSSGAMPYTATVVSKAAFFTTLFVLSAYAALLWIPPGRRLLNLVARIPEPGTPKIYFIIILATFAIGMIPWVFFTSGSLWVNLYRGMTAMRSGQGAVFTTGRSGNYNYSWGAYLAQVQEIGGTGGLLAAFYIVFTPGRAFVSKTISFFIWLFWTALGFGGGSRGEFLFSVLPVALLLFIKYMNVAADYLKRFSPRAVIYTSTFLFLVLIVVQIQGTFRNSGLETVNVSDLGIFKSQGNAMFSEGLIAYEYFPDPFPFAEDTFVGANFIRPVPDVIIRWGISWIPRALWHGKPGANAANAWINQTISGGTAVNEEGSTDVGGGTVCTSICGGSYMFYGFSGVIQIALVYGWMCKFAEAALWENSRRPLAALFCLGFCGYLIRAFRDLTPHDFYPLAIGVTAICILVMLSRPFTGQPMATYTLEVA